MSPIVSVQSLNKTYSSGFEALGSVDLDIEDGEILALLGPNGAGKTTLISAVCGIVTPTSGKITVGGFDVVKEFRKARNLIGLVPQELTVEAFESVIATVRYSRGLFGKGKDDAHIEKVLKSLSLWDKKDSPIMALSGGMKRRVLIAKALSHEPRVLFLDEPTAGVDVELRQDMWNVVRGLQADGVTTILTTHYIEEAEQIADRIAVILKGDILLVEKKEELMARLGHKQVRIDLASSLTALPASIEHRGVELAEGGNALIYSYDSRGERTGITALLNDLQAEGLQMTDLSTHQSSLEDIFVGLVRENA